MFLSLPFVIKLAVTVAVFRRLWTTDAFVWVSFLKNSKEDFGVRMWQLLSLCALLFFLLADVSIPTSVAALSIVAFADTVVRKLSELNGTAHGILEPERKF